MVGLFEELLSSDERLRAESFYSRRDAECFAISHGLLRIVLARYANVSPETLDFASSAAGKPSVRCPKEAVSLKFSLSHSEDIVLIAISRDVDIGVDVEYIRDDFEFEPVLESIAAEIDTAYLRAVDGPPAFYRLWTCLEAIAKAQGSGLDVGFQKNSALALADHARSPSSKEGRLIVYDLPPIAGYAASLAICGTKYDVQCWQSSTALFESAKTGIRTIETH
jgi:4'-phosphopantetheinyl transferase